MGQTEIEQGIEVLFQRGLNYWTPIEMLFDKEAIKRGTRVKLVGVMIQRVSRKCGSSRESL